MKILEVKMKWWWKLFGWTVIDFAYLAVILDIWDYDFACKWTSNIAQRALCVVPASDDIA